MSSGLSATLTPCGEKFVYDTVVLCILDGFGIAPQYDQSQARYNPMLLAQIPTISRLLLDNKTLLLEASGEFVGLEPGQMGNSEVGHMTIGAGRVIQQTLPRINSAFTNSTFEALPAIQKLLVSSSLYSDHAADIQAISGVETRGSQESLSAQSVPRKKTSNKSDNKVHLIGLFSDGGVHSSLNHLLQTISILLKHQKTIVLHLISDGRDVEPRSIQRYIDVLLYTYRTEIESKAIQIATLCGRYYAMDRDQRLERTKRAFEAIYNCKSDKPCVGAFLDTYQNVIAQMYASNISDEFFPPIVFEHLLLDKNDEIVFFNFRADRMRQIMRAICAVHPIEHIYTFTQYDFLSPMPTVIFPLQKVENSLSAVLASHSLPQLKVAETEKYQHVTFFLNGGAEAPFSGEERILIPSPKVATYDLQPEMSAHKITDVVIRAIASKKYAMICVNYANADMVGHTGEIDAAILALETLDQCIQKLINTIFDKELSDKKIAILITADHGNIECLFNQESAQKHTAHTTNPVPCFFVSNCQMVLDNKSQTNIEQANAAAYARYTRISKFGLSSIATTILKLLGITKPQEMDGEALF